MKRAVFLFCLLVNSAFGQVPTRDGLPTFAPVLEKVMPAVVNIAVLQKSPEEQNPLLRDPFFRRFFGQPQPSQPQISAGSGVIVDAKNGYVITNAARGQGRARDPDHAQGQPPPRGEARRYRSGHRHRGC
jgi:S1-C subfamily serine protease